MIYSKHPEMKCKFEPFCDCDGHTLCTFCGWNPKERQRRVEILRQQAACGETPRLTIKRYI